MKRFSWIYITVCIMIFFASQICAEKFPHDQYKVAIKDVLDINVLDHRELSAKVIVGEDGSITFPHIGFLYVKDMTLQEIQEEITKRLSEGYLKYPVVTVSLYQSAVRMIFTYGEFLKRGGISFEEKMTLLSAMSLAGGVSEEGRYGRLQVKRKQKKDSKYTVILDTDLHNGDLKNKKLENTPLQPEDILVIERSDTFLIQGEAGKRGRLILEKDMTVLRALLEAGGATQDGMYGTVKVRRKRKGAKEGYRDFIESRISEGVIESKEVEDTVIQPDDILIIERSKTFLIQGEVTKRGRFVLEKDMTLLRALLEAGGVSPDGLYGTVKVRRMKEGMVGEYTVVTESRMNEGVIESKDVEDTILQADDILIVEKNKTFLIQGETAKRGRFVLEKDMTLLRALLEAGGVTSDGLYGRIKLRRKQEGAAGGYKVVVESGINEGVIESKEVEDTFLEQDDVLIIEQNKTYFIYGEANKTGEFLLKDNMTVFKAITIAGGFTKWGSESRVKVLRMKEDGSGFETIKVDIEDVLDGDADADIILKAGDTIVVSTGVF